MTRFLNKPLICFLLSTVFSCAVLGQNPADMPLRQIIELAQSMIGKGDFAGASPFLDELEIRRLRPQQFLQCNDALRRRVQLALRQLALRHMQRIDHALRIQVDQHGALVNQDLAVKKAARTANFSSVNFDIVTGPELGIDAEFTESSGCRIAYLACETRQL